jgi:hypothetical protein
MEKPAEGEGIRGATHPVFIAAKVLLRCRIFFHVNEFWSLFLIVRFTNPFSGKIGKTIGSTFYPPSTMSEERYDLLFYW